MLAMGRAMMSKPRILLLDEPSMGLSPLFVGEIFKIIEKVSSAGTTVLLVEQNAKKGPVYCRPCLCAGNGPHQQIR